jgi:hypothetical protein
MTIPATDPGDRASSRNSSTPATNPIGPRPSVIFSDDTKNHHATPFHGQDLPISRASSHPAGGAEAIDTARARSLTIDYHSLSIRISEAHTHQTADSVIREKWLSDYHCVPINDLRLRYNTSTTDGLSASRAENLLKRHGPNEISAPPARWFGKLVEYAFGGFCSILWVAVIICILAWKPVGDPPDPTNLGLG